MQLKERSASAIYNILTAISLTLLATFSYKILVNNTHLTSLKINSGSHLMPLQIPEGVTPSSNDQLVILGAEFQTLRNTKGHYEGAEFNSDVDAPNGKKHQMMSQLLEQLGNPGTKGSDIIKIMGPPDEVSENAEQGLQGSSSVPTMPGPFLNSSNSGGKVMYLIYHWRGRHDYMYFKLDKDENVEKGDWYQALE